MREGVVIAVATKIDTLEEGKLGVIERVEAMAKEKRMICVQTSSKTGEGVSDAFQQLGDAVIQEAPHIINAQPPAYNGPITPAGGQGRIGSGPGCGCH